VAPLTSWFSRVAFGFVGRDASGRTSRHLRVLETLSPVRLRRCATKASKHRGAARDPARVERIKHRQRWVGRNAKCARMRSSRLCFKEQEAIRTL
jgi:hypothetical protein